MGFLDILRGKRELKKPAPDRLFAMSTAQVTMETTMGLTSSGKAAIVFQPLATADFEGIVRDMEEVVRGTGDDAGTKIEATDDEYGYRWMVLADDDFEDLVVGVNAVSTVEPISVPVPCRTSSISATICWKSPVASGWKTIAALPRLVMPCVSRPM